MKRKEFTVYSKKTGAEIREGIKEKTRGEWKEKRGVVVVRFFSMEKNQEPIYLSLNQVECLKVARTIKALLKKKEKKSVNVLIHKLEKDGKEKTTTLAVEFYGKGVAIIATQKNGNKQSINVPMDTDTAIFVAEFFSYLATETAWVEREKIEGASDEPVENPPSDELEEVVEDDELDDIDDVEF